MCDQFPINLKFTYCLCKSKHGYRSCSKRYKFRKHADFPKSIFYTLKEHLVRKEKFALPPYCKEVSKKQTLKDSCSFFVVSSIVETVGPLNVCTVKNFAAKLRISNQKYFMFWIVILLEAKYCGIMYARIVLFVLHFYFFNAKGI